MAPTLPARKAGGKRTAAPNGRSAPPNQSQTVTLEDGTEVPLKMPAGMNPAAAEALVGYLKSNPEVAAAAYQQAMTIMKTPGMADAFLQQSTQSAAPPMDMTKLNLLKDDPELKHVFDDMAEHGHSALMKYWDDMELMTKISAKLRAISIESGEVQAPKTPDLKPVDTLHDAAKQGNVDALVRLLDEGKDINSKNEKAVSVLGIAVGFNRVEVVKALLERGVDLAARDAAGNTALHYAAGYGRREVAELLLDAGADMDVTNNGGQTPLEAAKMNHEKQVVEFLKERWVAKKKAAKEPKAAK